MIITFFLFSLWEETFQPLRDASVWYVLTVPKTYHVRTKCPDLGNNNLSDDSRWWSADQRGSTWTKRSRVSFLYFSISDCSIGGDLLTGLFNILWTWNKRDQHFTFPEIHLSTALVWDPWKQRPGPLCLFSMNHEWQSQGSWISKLQYLERCFDAPRVICFELPEFRSIQFSARFRFIFMSESARSSMIHVFLLDFWSKEETIVTLIRTPEA